MPTIDVKQMSPFERLMYWIRNRELARQGKEEGKPKPWTSDPIIQTTRFCNVRREHDKVTVWISENWRTPHANDPHLWFAMCIARLLNLPESLAAIGYPTTWDSAKFLDTLNARKKKGLKNFNGAYIVSTNGKKMEKLEYLVEYVLDPLYKDRERIRPRQAELLSNVHKRLMQYDGMGSFMAAQVIADIKYAPVLRNSRDWLTFAASGPGSRRGMNRLYERPITDNWREAEWYQRLTKLLEQVNARVRPIIHAQDLQNCLCEFDKFERVLWGDGRAKQQYPGK